jgi:hypothetical protein
MEGFYLLVGHMLGDYIVQNDWQAKWKTNPPPDGECGPRERAARQNTADLACTVHCLLYTLAVWLFSFSWMPWWGLAVCFVAHFVIDRFRLAGRWMRNVSGQAAFATGPLAPWSIIVVDNTFHLITLAVIAALAGR